MLSLAALLLAGAQPAPAVAPAVAATAAAADAEAVFGIFEKVCLSKGEVPAGFEPAAWTDFPPALRLMNTYGHAGTFFRRGDGAMYMARAEGPGHMMPGIERRCSIAARGFETAGIIENLAKRAQAEKTSALGGAGASMTLIAGRGGVFDVTRVEDGWIIIRSQEILIRADSIPRRYRARKGKRN